MPDVLIPVSLTVDLRRNTIEIVTDADEAGGAVATERHLLEMGAHGRMLGIDFDDAYLMVCPSSDDDAGLVRAIDIELTVQRNAEQAISSVSVPRRGAGYEITFPSGNQ